MVQLGLSWQKYIFIETLLTRKLIRRDLTSNRRKERMNSRSIREVLTLAFLAGTFFIILNVNVGLIFKIFMAVLVFAIVLLLGVADAALKQVEDKKF